MIGWTINYLYSQELFLCSLDLKNDTLHTSEFNFINYVFSSSSQLRTIMYFINEVYVKLSIDKLLLNIVSVFFKFYF